MSGSINVTNGVHQGGILSPWLFNLYIDEPGCMLSNVSSGCKFANVSVNHLSYADDMCLLSPFASGLQKMLGIRHAYMPRSMTSYIM